MSDNTGMATIYSREFTQAYQQEMSWLRGTVQTEGEVQGQTFVFHVSGVVQPAVKRGSNGQIPYSNDTQSQVSCTLDEYFGQPLRKNNFNIMSSSVDQRAQMQKDGVKSINLTTDQLIISQMTSTTLSTNGGSAKAADIGWALEASAILDAQFVPRDGNRYAIISPKAMAQLMKIYQFANDQWVSDKPFMKLTTWRNWNDCKWAVHPNVPGVGTNSVSCFMFHKNSIGHGLNDGEFKTAIGFNEEHDYSWAHARSYQGAKTLQSNGIVKMLHDDTAAV